MAILKKNSTIAGAPILSTEDIDEYLKANNVYTKEDLNIDNYVEKSADNIEENVDLNVFFEKGDSLLLNPLNAPLGVRGKIFLNVKGDENNKYIIQKINDENNNNFIRNKIGPRWSIWKEIGSGNFKRKSFPETFVLPINSEYWKKNEKNYELIIKHSKNTMLIIPYAVNNNKESVYMPFKILDNDNIVIYSDEPFDGDFYGIALYSDSDSNIFTKNDIQEKDWTYDNDEKNYYLEIKHNLSSSNILFKMTDLKNDSILAPYKIIDENNIRIYSDNPLSGKIFLMALV